MKLSWVRFNGTMPSWKSKSDSEIHGGTVTIPPSPLAASGAASGQLNLKLLALVDSEVGVVLSGSCTVNDQCPPALAPFESGKPGTARPVVTLLASATLVLVVTRFKVSIFRWTIG